jgi:hypothetical protein
MPVRPRSLPAYRVKNSNLLVWRLDLRLTREISGMKNNRHGAPNRGSNP